MAASKYYAYYMRGSRIALIEYDSSTGGGQTLDQPGLNDIGPGGGLSWKSPTSSVTNGIEIEYAYSPRYVLPGLVSTVATADRTQWYVNGWISVDGYLTIVSSGQNWASYANLSVDDYIVIRGSSRWNGVHKIKELQNQGETTHGGLKTHTRVTDELPFTSDSSTTWGTDGTISLIAIFSIDHFVDSTTTPYIWLSGSNAASENGGMFSGWSSLLSGTKLDLSSATRYLYATNLVDEDTADTDFTSDTTSPFYMYQAFHEPSMYVLSGADVLSDEEDLIDLPEYLTKALVYYVKAKIAEDRVDLDQKEYFMKEFHRILEKHESSRIWGGRMLGPGPSAIR